MATHKLNLVVAMCNNRGIGINGQLPWRLRGDMAFFKKMTSDAPDPARQNAVIMGRKTWDSIPAKFRPLQNRINVVISRNMAEAPEGAHLARSLEEAITLVTSEPLADNIGQLFVIGGSSIYELALKSPSCQRIYLTRVLADFECDTFLPSFDTCIFKKTEVPEVDGSPQTEKDIEYQFEVYEKRGTGPVFNIMVAMEKNRGIGFKGGLPWPFLRQDYDHYTRHVSTPKQAGNKCAIIFGRRTYEGARLDEVTLPNVMYVVVSQTLRVRPPHVDHLASSLDDAVRIVTSPPLCDVIDSIWVMGGSNIYKEAMDSSSCHRLYITRIHTEFEADRFFPNIPDTFTRIRDPSVEGSDQEYNGIKFHFEVYEQLEESTTAICGDNRGEEAQAPHPNS